jgi:ppGpp synthetase/RelA/SpoT-type nucleotidyltranferase
MGWAIPEFSKSRVNTAGKILASKDFDIGDWLEALHVVNNWRASHSFPLNTFQNGLRKKAKSVDRNCLVAQRIKRLSSIEEKLVRFPTMTVSQMQDIGGV